MAQKMEGSKIPMIGGGLHDLKSRREAMRRDASEMHAITSKKEMLPITEITPA